MSVMMVQLHPGQITSSHCSIILVQSWKLLVFILPATSLIMFHLPSLSILILTIQVLVQADALPLDLSAVLWIGHE